VAFYYHYMNYERAQKNNVLYDEYDVDPCRKVVNIMVKRTMMSDQILFAEYRL
jgi:hypothetical protein